VSRATVVVITHDRRTKLLLTLAHMTSLPDRVPDRRGGPARSCPPVDGAITGTLYVVFLGVIGAL
jgi:hypothetical protein